MTFTTIVTPTIVCHNGVFNRTKQEYKQYSILHIACTTDRTNFWLPKPLFWADPPVYQDLIACHDWPIKKATVNLPIRLKQISKRISGNSFSLFGAQNKDICAASQMLLIRVR